MSNAYHSLSVYRASVLVIIADTQALKLMVMSGAVLPLFHQVQHLEAAPFRDARNAWRSVKATLHRDNCCALTLESFILNTKYSEDQVHRQLDRSYIPVLAPNVSLFGLVTLSVVSTATGMSEDFKLHAHINFDVISVCRIQTMNPRVNWKKICRTNPFVHLYMLLSNKF